MGTNIGSLKSASDYSRETLTQKRPHLVNPILFPNTILNCAAGQAAIWHSLKGVNATVSGGQLSGLLALRYASMAIRQGYADTLLAGSVEEFTPHSAWGIHHSGLLQGTDTLFGEGCALFAIEELTQAQASKRTVLAEILACEITYCNQPDDHEMLLQAFAKCIQCALNRAGVTPDEIEVVSSGAIGCSPLDDVESRGIQLALGKQPEHTLCVKRQVGECYSAASALQLAALLAFFQTQPVGKDVVSLVLTVSQDGGMGCSVIRRSRE